jgi:hypothetical protein
MEYRVSVHRMLDDFQSIEQVVTYFPGNRKGKRCILNSRFCWYNFREIWILS